MRLGRHTEPGEQRGIERGVSQADPVVLEAGCVQGAADDRQHLGGPVRSGRADQLDAGLEHLARVAALRPDRPVAVGEVAEAQRRLGVRVARRDHPRDRDRHVRAQDEDLAVLVEQAVGRTSPAQVGAGQHRLVLERGGVHLAVAGVLEDAAHGLRDGAQLARFVRKDVSGPARDGMDHRHWTVASAAFCAGCCEPRIAAAFRRPGRRHPAAAMCQAWTGSVATRSICAPSSRSRSSIRS